MESRQHQPEQNQLFRALPADARERVFPYVERVPLTLGQVLYESGATLQHVYFPADSIISLLYVMEDGASAEIAVVGKEGMVGVALFMGGETTPNRAVVQSAGHAYRLRGQLLKQEFGRKPWLCFPTPHLLYITPFRQMPYEKGIARTTRRAKVRRHEYSQTQGRS